MSGRGPGAYARVQGAGGGDPREAHLHLVVEQADRALGRLPPGTVERQELISLGAIGLMEGLERFDSSRGVPLEAYLRSVIRHRILDGLREQDRVPKGLRQRERLVREAYARVEQRLLRPAEDKEVADELGLDVEAYHGWLADLAFTTVWSLEVLEEAQGVEPVQDGPGPHESAEAAERQRALAAAIGRLPERERQVLWAHYYEDYSLHEVALALELSDSYVSQLHSRAILRLRGALGRRRDALLGRGGR